MGLNLDDAKLATIYGDISDKLNTINKNNKNKTIDLIKRIFSIIILKNVFEGSRRDRRWLVKDNLKDPISYLIISISYLFDKWLSDSEIEKIKNIVMYIINNPEFSNKLDSIISMHIKNKSSYSNKEYLNIEEIKLRRQAKKSKINISNITITNKNNLNNAIAAYKKKYSDRKNLLTEAYELNEYKEEFNELLETFKQNNFNIKTINTKINKFIKEKKKLKKN
jgi:hypothetical protein